MKLKRVSSEYVVITDLEWKAFDRFGVEHHEDYKRYPAKMSDFFEVGIGPQPKEGKQFLVYGTVYVVQEAVDWFRDAIAEGQKLLKEDQNEGE